MAPKPEVNTEKRKRGRPRRPQGSNSQQQPDASRDEQGPDHDDVQDDAENERPRKRGRTSKHVQSSSAGAEVQSRRRGRPRQSLDDDERQQPERETQKQQETDSRKQRETVQETRHDSKISTTQDLTDQPRRRRGRPPPQAQAADADTEQDATEEVGPASRRRKLQSAAEKTLDDNVSTREDTAGDSAVRTRKRAPPARSEPAPSQAQETSAQISGPKARRRKGRGHPEDGGGDKDDAQDEDTRPRELGGKSRRDQEQTRPPRDTQAKPKRASKPSPARKEDSQTQPRKKKRRSAPDPAGQASDGAAPGGDERRGSSRRQANDEAQTSAPATAEDRPPSPERPYAHVVAQVRRVRQSTITAKWSPLAEPSMSAVSTLLHLAHQPILQRLSNTQQRRAHASSALHLMMRRIVRKVARGLPFPPASMPPATSSSRTRRGQQQQQQQISDGGRETELNFESVLDATAALEAQLAPATHAVDLLTREKERIESELERDYDTLRQLEASARAQAREQRGILKKAHVLTPMATASTTSNPSHDERADEHKTALTAGGNVFTELNDDPELRQLAAQLAGHVNSISANMRQTDGLLPQLAQGRAALQAALLKNLDQAQYERVVLGS